MGDDVLKAFENSPRFSGKRLLMSEKSRPNKKEESDVIKLYEYGKRLIVNIAANQGGMRKFDKYFPEGSQIV